MLASKILVFFTLLAGSALAAPMAKRALDQTHQTIANTIRDKINTWPAQIAALDAKGQKKSWEAVDHFLQDLAKAEGMIFNLQPGNGVVPQFIQMGWDDNVAKINLQHLSYNEIQREFNEVDETIAQEAKHHTASQE